MSYVFVESENPSAMQQRPYSGGLLPAQYQTPGSAMVGLGLTEDQQKTLKNLLLIAGVLLLGYWLFFSKNSPLKRNPGRGKNKVVKLSGSSENGWHWRLLRKGSKRHGPFATQDEAADDAEGYGYKVLV
jgi:hypothetical protein